MNSEKQPTDSSADSGTLACGACGATEGVQMEPSRTCYHREPGEPNPNADIALCRDCATDHHAHWDDRWAEYYRSVL